MIRSLAASVVVLFATACGPQRMATGPSELQVTPTLLDFGVVPVSGESVLSITLTNLGGGDINLLSVTLTEGDPDHWSVDRSVPDVVMVGFTPDQVRGFTGAVQIRTDAAIGEPSVTVPLNGMGGPSDADEDGDGWSVADGDCDDGNPDVSPGATEVCDGLDNDCSGAPMPDELDEDDDDWFVCNGDCDDNNDETYPGAVEVCDGLDNDCDNAATDYDDVDGDGASVCQGDCDDNDASASPYQVEMCDGVDNNCDGAVDFIDSDGDGHSVCPPGEDCDDNDAAAHPIVADPDGSSGGDGTPADPVDSIDGALALLDQVCRTIVLEDGTYDEVEVVWNAGTLSLIGRSGLAADVILQAADDARHFKVEGGAVLLLESLSLMDGEPAGDGGAIQILSSTAHLDGVIIDDNVAGADGGAIAATPGSLTLVGGSVVRNNQATDDGGAILASGATIVDVGTTYEGNTGTLGGALRIEGGTLVMTDAIMSNNTGEEGGALSLSGTGAYTVERSEISANTAAGVGGAIAMQGVVDDAGVIRSNLFQDNTAGAGGAIAIVGGVGEHRVHNNTFAGNEATGGEGAAVLVTASNAAGLEIVSNVADGNNGASALYVVSDPGLGPVFTHNTSFFTNSGVHFGGDVGDGAGGPSAVELSNQARDPLLDADLSLLAGSPERDDGPLDPAFNDTDGTQNDRGHTGGPAAQ